MLDLTVIILTKNEEKNIEKCIDSFNNIAKRFVIVDSYSTDNTKNICKKLQKELKKKKISLDFYENKWVNYATQFNWAIENTNIKTKWTMRMDADEELLPELVSELKEKLPAINNYNGIILRRRLIFLGKWIRHGGRYPEFLLRIWKTGYGICEQKMMDEHIILSEGKTLKLKNDFIDNNQKNLDWWIGKHNWYSNREVIDYYLAEQKTIKTSTSTNQAKFKRIVKDNVYYSIPKFFRAHIYFLYRYYIRLGFLDGKEGKIFNFLQAYWYRFLVDAKIFEGEKFNVEIENPGDLK